MVGGELLLDEFGVVTEGELLLSCVTETIIGDIVGVTVGLAMGDLDGPRVGSNVIGVITGEFDGEELDGGSPVGEDVGDTLIVGGEDVGFNDKVGENVGNLDGILVVGGEAIVSSSTTPTTLNGEAVGLNDVVRSSFSSSKLQTSKVQVNRLLNPHPPSQHTLLSISSTVHTLIPLLEQCNTASEWVLVIRQFGRRHVKFIPRVPVQQWTDN